MKYNCEVIGDLLPLYVDKACSASTAEVVEQHLSECSSCSKLCTEMKSDIVLDSNLQQERNNVLEEQSRFFKRRSVLAGCIIGGIFTIPILVCLIVNLVSGAGLTWFFIVLAAMLLPTSLIIVPLMAVKDKLLWTILSFVASLLILLAVCCIYSGGSWFFVTAASVLFGLSLPLTPFIVRARPIAERIGNHKGLALVSTYTATFLLMMLCIGLTVEDTAIFFRMAAAYSIMPLLCMWAVFALIRYPKWNAFGKAAASIMAASLIYFLNDTVFLLLSNYKWYFPSPVFAFDTMEHANDSVSWMVLIGGGILAAIFAAISLIQSSRKENYR